MSRTDKTRPYWVRQTDPTDEGAFLRPCGSGCTYCGMGKVRRKFGHHSTRNAANQHLKKGDWREEFE